MDVRPDTGGPGDATAPGVGREPGRPGRGGAAWVTTALLTAAMGVSMLQLFLIGALGPRLVEDEGYSRGLLGLTTTAGFGVACALSLTAGSWVDRFGPRRSLIALLVVAAGALALIGSSTGPAVLLAAVALGGLPQALANPATNKVIIAAVAPGRRGAVTGWKQSGVQLGAFAAGLPFAFLADRLGWRGAVWSAAACALLIAVGAAVLLPRDPDRKAAPTAVGARARVGRLAAFSLALGSGIASVNTYLALYGAQRLGLGAVVAAGLVAVLGVTGIAGRVGWSRRAGNLERPVVLLAPLAVGACAAALVLGASAWAAPLVWVGAAAVGSFAAAGNAVSMVAVVRGAEARVAGRASALVSAGFFGGFALGPPLFGAVVAGAGYGPAWLLVAAEFAVATLIVAPRWSRA